VATELLTWQNMSLYAFLSRHREVLRTDPKTWSSDARATHNALLRYGIELDVLELDLRLTVDELRTAYEVLYAEPRHLARKKFAVVYHIDNFYVRVHKLLEDLHGLLALMVGLAPDAKPTPGSVPRRLSLTRAFDKWGLTRVDARLRRFEDDGAIRAAREARNFFVHRYRDEPKWPALEPASRLLEFEDTDESERMIRRELEPTEIDRYADRKTAEFDRIVELIGTLRADLYEICLREIVTVVSRETVDVRRRWHWLSDIQQFVRDARGGS
jgi:hypothetical protein